MSNNPGSSGTPEALPFTPAGLELLHSSESSKITSSFHALYLAVHWSLMRAGLRRVHNKVTLDTSKRPNAAAVAASSDSSAAAATARDVSPVLRNAGITESPVVDWNDRITAAVASDDPVKFDDYVNPLCPHEGYYTLSLYQMNTSILIRLTNLHCPAAMAAAKSTDAAVTDTQAINVTVDDYVHFGPTTESTTNYLDIYYNAAALERMIWTMLSHLGLRVLGQVAKSIGTIYEDNPPTSTGGTSRSSSSTSRIDYGDEEFQPRRPLPNPDIGGPLYVPPVGSGGLLGRSDLDPLGRIGSGMLADPRGLRRPHPGLPGLPDARFDPFGPVGPGGPLPPGRGRARLPPFGGPNPDEPPPPGFDDMFM